MQIQTNGDRDNERKNMHEALYTKKEQVKGSISRKWRFAEDVPIHFDYS